MIMNKIQFVNAEKNFLGKKKFFGKSITFCDLNTWHSKKIQVSSKQIIIPTA